jgi:hypothetical protein
MRNTKLPRLTQAMQYAAILSYGEAQACIRDYRNGNPYSSEAVNHYGSDSPHPTKKVIVTAVKLRHVARDSEARRRERAAIAAGRIPDPRFMTEEDWLDAPVLDLAAFELGLSEGDTWPV